MPNIEFDFSIDDCSSFDRRLSHQDCEGLFQVGKQSPDIADGVGQKAHSSRTEASSTTPVSNSKPPTSNNGNKQSRQKKKKKRRKRERGERVKEERRKKGTLRNQSASRSRRKW